MRRHVASILAIGLLHLIVVDAAHPGSAGGSNVDGPVVETDAGAVRGFRYSIPELDGVGGTAFLGIPFAEPPVGDLRFRHPIRIRKPWSGVRNATRLPNSCHQAPDLFFGPDFPGSTMWNPNTDLSEDCLFVNVWVPDSAPLSVAAAPPGGARRRKGAAADEKRDEQRKKLPVMIWIFGGGFYSGTTTLDVYDGRILASHHDVVVVSIGYRVGALGFLCLNHPSAPCNAGLYDQLLGLDWVQRNVEAFGGDRNSVTLFGESAGSASVSLHLLSPLSRDKFHRAILQSGSANMPWATTSLAEGQLRSEELAITYMGCRRTADPAELADCLRAVDASRLVDEQWVSRGILQFPFLPVVDGVFLPEPPEVLIERRRFKHCPILIGSNHNEGSWFIVYELSDRLTDDQSGQSTRVALEVPPDDMKMMPRENFLLAVNSLFFYYPQYRRQLNSTFGIDAISFQYTDWTRATLDDSASNLHGLDDALADSNFVCPLNHFAASYAEAGLPVYSYFFTHAYEANPWPKWMGVMHGDEVLFMFGHVLREPDEKAARWKIFYNEDDKLLSRRMMRYWTNFAKTGDPNGPPFGPGSGSTGRVQWPLHSASRREYLELNARLLDETDPSKVIGRAPRAKQCAFWAEYLPKLISATANISEREKAWKLEFSEWTTRYIVDWKTQYDLFVRQQRDGCPPR